MSNRLQQSLDVLASAVHYGGLGQFTRGIEKESLRITPQGQLAQTSHPIALGSPLTHPQITTDYSEALLEFITSPCTDSAANLAQLNELHAFTYQNMGNERLWATSMPCILGKNSDIPIAQYGTSNSGTMKSTYRLGLGHRYGRSMQTIAGIHYNFSVSDTLWEHLRAQENSTLPLQDFKTQGYFRLIRNFRRYYWLLLYLYGASPSVCKSFVSGKKHRLVPLGHDDHSLHTPYATSLRMGDLGYQSHAQHALVITYNNLDSYIKTLCCAITQAHPNYADIGIKDASGKYQQLNDCLLQIENEFYSVIRPKRTAHRGETALTALDNNGVEYIEVRCLDINPYEPVGINEQQIHFLDTFLLYCLLSDSPLSNRSEYDDIQENQHRMVYNGRKPNLTLKNKGRERLFKEWAESLMSEINRVAVSLDAVTGKTLYQESIRLEQEKLHDVTLTPSAKILADMRNNKLTFLDFASQLSTQHQAYFSQYPLDDRLDFYRKRAEQSLQQQVDIENNDKISFYEYLNHYYSQYQSVIDGSDACPFMVL